MSNPSGQIIPHVRTRQRHKRGRAQIGLNLTAMIDVVFLLLVYFMVATQFKLGEEIYRMDLPERQPAQAPLDPFDLDDEPLRITVASLGSGAYQLRIEGPYEQPVTFDDLHQFLRARRIGQGTMGGLFEPDHPIIIAPAGSTRWDHVIEAFNSAVRARYTNITFGQPE
jgi:biopolymer transport protein ExbD